MCRAHQLERARRERHALKGTIEHFLPEACKKPHALFERLLEIDFAAHRALGDRRNLLADARFLAQQVNDFFIDERRVDIHHDEAHVGGVALLFVGSAGRFERCGHGGSLQSVWTTVAQWSVWGRHRLRCHMRSMHRMHR
ncbi:putative uncharacterized protein [Collinsella sp. CAG:289]|nr:putative uncharacterized protein [Collinsella sp. CAG:289]